MSQHVLTLSPSTYETFRDLMIDGATVSDEPSEIEVCELISKGLPSYPVPTVVLQLNEKELATLIKCVSVMIDCQDVYQGAGYNIEHLEEVLKQLQA